MRLHIFEVDLCIAYRREKGIRERRRSRDRIFCLLVEDGISG